MSYFSNALQNLKDIGLMDVILPFLLVFTIIFAVLQKTSILGKDSKKYNVAVAFVIGLLVTVEGSVVEIMNRAIPNVGIVIVAVVMFLILVGVLGGDVNWAGGSLSGWIALIAFGVVLYIFGASAGWWGGHTSNVWFLDWLNDPQTASTVVILLVFGIVVWFITKEDKEENEGSKMMQNLGDMFKNNK